MRTFSLLLVSFITAFSFAACATDSGESASPSQAVCQRADDCNALGGSIKECTEEFDRFLDNLTPTDRDQFVFELENCLDQPACQAFGECVNNTFDNVE
jgi:hypothetical protein